MLLALELERGIELAVELALPLVLLDQQVVERALGLLGLLGPQDGLRLAVEPERRPAAGADDRERRACRRCRRPRIECSTVGIRTEAGYNARLVDTLLAIFVRVIVPVIVTVGVGYLAARLLVFDLKMLARLGLYVLVPCLTFTAMARTTLAAGEFGRIVAFTLISVPLLWGLSSIAARLLKLPPAEAGAFHISVLFTNAVNFGFPVLLLAYGPAALEQGIVYAMTAQIVMQSLGVYLAARGRADFQSRP
ncbi:MAG: AEC family transporter [Ignavibacteriales bacterium]|nr:AEC family transporter [Ignavibacteriales bacterium]